MSETQDEINRRLLDTHHLADGLKGRTVRGGLVNMVAQIVSMVLQIGSLAILARLLTPADYGLLAMATTATVFAAIFTNLGLTTPTVQRSTITHEQVCTLFYINLMGGGVIFLLSCVAAPLFAYVFHDSRVISIIILLSLAIPLGAAGAQFNAVLIRNMRWVTIQAINIGSQLVGIVSAIILAWQFSFGVWALVAQQLVTAVLMFLLNYTLCAWRPSRHFDLSEVRSELAMGMDIALFSLLNYVHRQFDNIIIGSRWGAVELGIYSRGYNLMGQVNLAMTGPIGSALTPSLSRVASEPDRWKRHFTVAAVATATFSGAVFALLYVNTSQIVSLLFGKGWEQVTPILGYLFIAGLATSVNAPFGWIFICLGRTRQQLHWIMFAAPMLLVAFWIGSAWGGLGVAIAYAATIIAINFVYIALATRGTVMSYVRSLFIVIPVYVAFAVAVAANWHFAGFLRDAAIIIQMVAQSCIAMAGFGLVIGAASVIDPSFAATRRIFLGDIVAFLARKGLARPDANS